MGDHNGKGDGGARWTLSRAGIINVYQYGDETLHFGGGRLLLRGVNGSGKSTAMNMLLPFLLDGDTRRIDAAGEQSGVLRSWMLSGREEPQPQGYLWLELACGEEFLSFGCGIRANRSTDRVTTWWFITSRRPGIDLHLVEGRVPLSAEQLRGAIHPGVVYSHDQRAAYRAELRTRLFGGGDLEQHLRLLRIVRNPRVGDRLDAELPQYLQDALPQLSEAALDDAAQPLEDLEEHRRNVTDLGRTVEALGAIEEVYARYARTELHRNADAALESTARHERRRRAQARARAAEQEAAKGFEAATQARFRHELELSRLQEEITSLQASDAYRSGAELNDLRNHVGSLEEAVRQARAEVERRRAATLRASAAVAEAVREAREVQGALGRRLSQLAERASDCGLAARPPASPVAVAGDADPQSTEVPATPIDITPPERQLAALRAAAQQRGLDVDEVERALGVVETTERDLRAAEAAVADAEEAHAAARAQLQEARGAFETEVSRWQLAASGWLEQLVKHCDEHGLEAASMPAELDNPADRVALGQSLTAPLRQLVDVARTRHQERRAALQAALESQAARVAECEARVAELAARQLADPPQQPWQRREGRACLAEWIDFADDLDAASRAGLEAALEASGLLAAEVHEDGALELVNGQLLVMASAAAATAPLGRLLRVEAPGGSASASSVAALERVLDSISTELSAQGERTVMATGGEFRLGVLRGRHTKVEAEHIGVSARRRALERQRAEALQQLERALEARGGLRADLEAATGALAEANGMATAIPPDRAAIGAHLRWKQSEEGVERAAEQLQRRRSAALSAERQHATAAEHLHGLALRLALPSTQRALAAVRGELSAAITECTEAQSELKRLARAVEQWRARAAAREAERNDERESRTHLERVEHELDARRTRLATLEESIGAEYARVVAAVEEAQGQLKVSKRGLQEADDERLAAQAQVTATRAAHEAAAVERQRAEEECLRLLPTLREILAVPGLLAAVVPSAPADDESEPEASGAVEVPVAFPGSEESPEGLRLLAEAIRTQVPAPGDEKASADSVRQSLRKRRDALGAGWDAEDHQPEEHLPLRIDVTGPLAPQVPLPEAGFAVRRQLLHMKGLLSAKQDQALRNLLQGLVAREVAEKLHAAGELIAAMNRRLSAITTSHGIGVTLRWRQRDDLELDLAGTVRLLAKPPDLRTAEEDGALSASLGQRIDEARRDDPELPYRELIGRVLDYRQWYRMGLILHRPGRSDERLSRRTALSEGEKKIVSYLPLFAAVAASCDGLAVRAPSAPRFVLLDDAFAKVSEDNHAKLFGLLVELDLDFIATSERLWGTHASVPELAITEVIRDADLGAIVLEHSRWNGRRQEFQ
ncbi:MAG: TIGR02680 family protein [Myxococcales bacterium]|nr:TIGR02680 family protein [Myxococcales bacterium]